MAFGHYGFPAPNELANFNSRLLQTLWAVMHFFLIGFFALNLILLLGAASYLKMCHLLVEQLDKINIGGTRLIDFQEFAYGLAGTIVGGFISKNAKGPQGFIPKLRACATENLDSGHSALRSHDDNKQYPGARI